MRQVVDAGAAEHRGHLGDGKHLEAQAAEVLDNLCHRRRLAGARAASQHNLSDFIGDLISHLLIDNAGFTKKNAKFTHNPAFPQPFHPKRCENAKRVKRGRLF